MEYSNSFYNSKNNSNISSSTMYAKIQIIIYFNIFIIIVVKIIEYL